MRKVLRAIAVALLVLFLAAAFTAPRDLVDPFDMPSVGNDPEHWLAAAEAYIGRQNAIIPETEKRIRWFDTLEKQQTEWVLVYFHGFSATRQEIAPVGEMIAQALGANLFETRLTGHGHAADPLKDVRAEQWLADGAEALAVGNAIGEKLILMGTSTGATLALAMVDHPAFESVSDLILLSPNFAPADPKSEYLTWPGGPQLAHLVAGSTRTWTAHNDLQARYWSTTYPMDAVIEMMRLVKFVRAKLPITLEQGVLTVYSPEDTVISVERMLDSLEQVSSPKKRLVVIPGSDDPGNHVLAGDIMAPQNNALLSRTVVEFVQAAQGGIGQ